MLWRILILVIYIFETNDLYAQWQIIQKSEINTNLPGRNSHASTILELKSGKLMATWFEGTHEGNSDVGIYFSKYDSCKWSAPLKIAEGKNDNGGRVPCWNPVLFQNQQGQIYIMYKTGPNPREWRGMKIFTENEGRTWSKPEKLPEGFLGSIKNKPLLLNDGKVLHPSSTESPDEKVWHVHFEISNQNLNKWTKINVNNGQFGLIQPALIRHKDGSIQALIRSRQNKIVSMLSSDEGKNWTLPKTLEIPNPNASVDAINMPDGTIIMVYNPLVAGTNWWEGRNVLKVAQSKDGENWIDILTLENQEKGEFSYPAIILSKTGEIHISYTNNRKNIVHVILKKN